MSLCGQRQGCVLPRQEMMVLAASLVRCVHGMVVILRVYRL